jgi:aryl-alcohol dehydrogenase-like predicted oxidoreductase
MDYRPLGHTGISVSPYCLGAMMFGAVGNPDHDDSIQGMTLIQMAIAFVTRHPAATSGTMFRISAEGGSVLPV